MGIGLKLRALRQERGLTLEQLEAASGVSAGTISALENRDSTRSSYLPQLARALGTTVEEIGSTGDAGGARLAHGQLPAPRRTAQLSAEHLEESRKLKALWDASDHGLTQAAFGDKYGIGNQSAVGQFLRGVVPLSLKAAIGFARGLNCSLREFSDRLADEADAIAAISKPSAATILQVVSNPVTRALVEKILAADARRTLSETAAARMLSEVVELDAADDEQRPAPGMRG